MNTAQFDVLADRFTSQRAAVSVATLAARALHLWLLAYVTSLACDHAAFFAPKTWVWPLLLACVALVGLWGRAPTASSLAACALLTKVDALAPFTIDGGNRIVAIELVLVAAMNVRGEASWAITCANTANVLAKLQLLLVYVGAGVAKAVSEPWQRGEALTRILSHPAWSDGLVGPWLLRHARVASALTHATTVWEILFVPLVLFRTTRRFALVVGVLFHAALAQVTGIFFFSCAMIACYALLLDEREAGLVLSRVSFLRRRTPS